MTGLSLVEKSVPGSQTGDQKNQVKDAGNGDQMFNKCADLHQANSFRSTVYRCCYQSGLSIQLQHTYASAGPIEIKVRGECGESERRVRGMKHISRRSNPSSYHEESRSLLPRGVVILPIAWCLRLSCLSVFPTLYADKLECFMNSRRHW